METTTYQVQSQSKPNGKWTLAVIPKALFPIADTFEEAQQLLIAGVLFREQEQLPAEWKFRVVKRTDLVLTDQF